MTPFFDLCWGDLQCQTLRPEPIKKTRLPKTQPSKQRNSMAWRTQEARFLTCAHCAPRFGLEMHPLHLRLRLGITTGKTTTSDPKAFPKRLPPEQGNSMAWRTQGHRFSTCVGWSSMSNVASRIYKKRRFCSFGVQFAPPIAFEIHRWHLRLRLDITTGKTTTSDPKAFPKRLPPEQGNSMVWRAQWHRFSTCAGVIFNVKRCGRNL